MFQILILIIFILLIVVFLCFKFSLLLLKNKNTFLLNFIYWIIFIKCIFKTYWTLFGLILCLIFFFKLIFFLYFLFNQSKIKKEKYNSIESDIVFIIFLFLFWILFEVSIQAPILYAYIAYMCIAATFVLPALALWFFKPFPDEGAIARHVCWSGAVAALSVLEVLLASSFTLGRAAGLKSNGQPYCIMIPDGSRQRAYREAKSKLELTVLTLRAEPQTGFNHAIMLQQDKNGTLTFNWSYRRENFMNDAVYPALFAGGWSRLSCRMDTDFFGKLPFL